MTEAERADLLFRARWELGLRGREPWAGVLARFREATRDAPPYPDDPAGQRAWVSSLTKPQRHAVRLFIAELSGGDAEKARGECRCSTCDPTGERFRAREERRRERAQRRPEPDPEPAGRHLRLLSGGGAET